MAAADTVAQRSERNVADANQLQAIDSSISLKRLSLRRSQSTPRKGSLEAAGFDTFFFAKRTPILEGHVFKDGNGKLNGFTKRYFLLFDGVLIYYTHHSSYEKDQKNFLVRF